MPVTVYFVTCCTMMRRPGLSDESVAIQISNRVIESDDSQDTTTFGFTIMPDHCHWVFQLGNRLSLGRVIAKLKARTNAALLAAGLNWQRDFYEHTLGPREDPEAYALYTFLNPYRAGLLPGGGTWPWWRSAVPDQLRFHQLLNPDGSPPPEWVGEPVPPSICHGE